MNTQLIDDLTALLKKSRADFNTGTDPEQGAVRRAYASGIEDALEIISRHLTLPEAFKKNKPEILTLHRMTASEALRFLQDTPEAMDTCSLKELQEAAFKFENELMACLDDMNTIFFDTYASMEKKELIQIITRSLEDISQVNGE